ncbi:bifunctional proline dehydrogenase/L-glutamate gamma-semialdehyde dehydrogenase PutA [Hirschia litorea]|uniref:Bifunctional protein PutA n=1 Tax=Hirschia litorea TaxID=1199156 RepID=A0ABW2II58_9PROT
MPFDMPTNSQATSSEHLLAKLSEAYVAPEQDVVQALQNALDLSDAEKISIKERTISLVSKCRKESGQGALFDQFLQEYGLSTSEGVTLMRLVEALIRTPDSETAIALVRDKLLAGDWKKHVNKSPSLTVNGASFGLTLSSTWIRLTGGTLANNLLARLGDKVLLSAVKRAMGIMSSHFVLGRSIEHAIDNSIAYENRGSTFSYDMLGEAAHTQKDADRYLKAYLTAANAIARKSRDYPSIKDAPGISVKLSALHPRYEFSKRNLCVPALHASLAQIARIAKAGNFGLTIDAEEADRLEVSLEIVEAILKDPEFENWDGLTIVVQAYQKRAPCTIAWLAHTARSYNRKIAVRLVKGAYWDMEIKRAQTLGLEGYPVYTRKENTDLAYLVCAQALFVESDVIFPQFATHNAQTAAAVMELAGDNRNYEFQRLHGMGPQLHENLIKVSGVKSRIYAPVGEYKDLLPYLVRRLLENGANSSFVNKLLDPEVPIESLAVDPSDQVRSNKSSTHPKIPHPRDILDGNRRIARGWDHTQRATSNMLETASEFDAPLTVASFIDGRDVTGKPLRIVSPFDTSKPIATAHLATEECIAYALDACAQSKWKHATPEQKNVVFNRAADLLEAEAHSFFSLCVHEAGKTLPDAIAEVREAVDFLRYYGHQITTPDMQDREPLGNVACISPWNFPLAIFLGQVVASLAAGNNVLAKPAEQTPVIAYKAVQLLYRAGIPHNALHLILGEGATIGSALVASSEVDGICFTGSTNTAKRIASTLASTKRPLTPFIAETGGMNAMIVDSTALIEQAVTDVLASSFQSAGQRCSACRIVCVQDSIADEFISMLAGAMHELKVGNPALLTTDVGPVIDHPAEDMLKKYIAEGRSKWKVIGEALTDPNPLCLNQGHFVTPIAFEIHSISELNEEKFGPVLHVIRFKSSELDQTIRAINALGYGLTMGQHSRIDSRVTRTAKISNVGNTYINRNQIGAVVGVQPFGGEGLSGTGPKAGGPLYLRRLSTRKNSKRALVSNIKTQALNLSHSSPMLERLQKATTLAAEHEHTWTITKAQRVLNDCRKEYPEVLEEIFSQIDSLPLTKPLQLPSPTGETNTLTFHARGTLVCYSENVQELKMQVFKALYAGNSVIALASNRAKETIASLRVQLVKSGLPEAFFQIFEEELLQPALALNIAGAVIDGQMRDAAASHLCTKQGPILPCLSSQDEIHRFVIERTVTINTTAAGGNASLLAM